MKKLILFCISISIQSVSVTPCYSRIITAANSGKWEDKTSWSRGVIPQCGDSVVIGSGKNIEANSMIDFSTCGNAMHITVSGKLSIGAGKKINLPCGSKIEMKDGGLITTATNNDISNSISICSETTWNNSKGNITASTTLEEKPKPAALVHFSAKPGTEGIILSWMTSSEMNNSGFTIEKSKDGISFTELGKVKGAGTSSKLSTYRFTDKTPHDGLQFYRLSQQDIKGEKRIMSPITIRWNHNPDFNVYPNPSNGELFVNVANSLRKKIGLLMITNKNGKVVVSKDISFSDKTKALSLLRPTEKLSPGEYEVNLICQGNLYTQQVTVK